MKNYLNQTPPSCPNQWIAPAYNSQTSIGWRSCFYGLFSPTWASQHNLAKPTRPNGVSLLTQIITIIFQALIHRWHERNAQLHNNTDHDENRSRLITKIRASTTVMTRSLHQTESYYPHQSMTHSNNPISNFNCSSSIIPPSLRNQSNARKHSQHANTET